MKVIGITGPTGAGKTTALNALRELGVEVIDADVVYHQLLAESEELKAALEATFGDSILGDCGQVDRRALAQAVYPDRLPELNAITHLFVVDEVECQIARAEEKGYPGVAIDAIALVESGLARRCDAVVAVLAPKEERIRRIMARDGIDEDYARRRVEAQQSDNFYRTCADYVLENGEGDTSAGFASRARTLFEVLLKQGAAPLT